MGASRKKRRLSRLIPKNHFCSMSFFRQEPLINWRYTDAVLFTAYDVYRSTDFWLDETINSGKTLKEGLIELGFPKSVSLVADTGVFEIEAKKAGIARNLGVEVDIELTNQQIFEAYKLSGADYFVAPDEIVLPQDNEATVFSKIDKIKENLHELLEVVHPSKIIAVIQGHTESVIEDLYDFYRSHKISCFAMGGVIPLYFHDKELLHKILVYVRKLAKNQWLHIFGLPRVSLLQYYLHEIGVDSVDTSTLLYLTAKRRYLIGSKGEYVSNAVFKDCGCEGCAKLDPRKPRSPDFFINLYIHNILAAVELSKNKSSRSTRAKSFKEKIPDKDHPSKVQDNMTPDDQQPESMNPIWRTADEALVESQGKFPRFLQPNDDRTNLEDSTDEN